MKNIKRIIFVILICIASSAYTNDTLTIVYTNSLNGNIDFCMCKENPNGGLVKRATAIIKLKKTLPNLILLETGDFFLTDKADLLAKFIIKSLKYINYDAVLFGDQEFKNGIKEFVTFRKDIPFLCNNILINTGSGFKRYYKRYKIVRRGSLSIGIIATISKDSFRFYSKKTTSKIRILKQEREIKKDIKKLKREKVDIIILLSHSGYERDRILAQKINGINLIVGGHSQTLLNKPVFVNKTMIVQAGVDGARIGVLNLIIKNDSILTFKNKFIQPDYKKPADDLMIRKFINQYKNELKKKYKRIRFTK